MRAAVSSELMASNMASSSSGSAVQEILADRQLFESQFGISFDEALLDSDESDLEVEVWEDDAQHSEVGLHDTGNLCWRLSLFQSSRLSRLS